MVGDDGEWLSGEEDGQDMEGLTAMEEKEYHEAFAGEDLDAVQEVSECA